MPVDLRLITLLESQGGFGEPGPPPPLFGSSVEASKAFTSVSGFTLLSPKTIPVGSDKILVVPVGFDYLNSSESGTLPHTHVESVTFNGINLKRLGRSDRHALASTLLAFFDFETPTYVTGDLEGQDGWTSTGDSTSGTGLIVVDATGHIDAQTITLQLPSIGERFVSKIHGFSTGSAWEISYDFKLLKLGSSNQRFRLVLDTGTTALSVNMFPGNNASESLSTAGTINISTAVSSLTTTYTVGVRHNVRVRQRGSVTQFFFDGVLIDTIAALAVGGFSRTRFNVTKFPGGSLTLGDNYAFDNYTINDLSPINAFSGGWPGRVELWYLLNPPAINANVIVTMRSFGGASTVAPLAMAMWDLTDANQTIPWGPFLGETRRDDGVTLTPNAFVNIACNPGELVVGTCLGRRDFDMDVVPSQDERFEITQTDPIDDVDIILAGSTQSGAPCVPTSWTNVGTGFFDRWCIGGAGLVGLITDRIAPVTQFQQDFESLTVGNDLSGQGGWVKLIETGPDVNRWVVDGSSIIDGAKSIVMKAGAGSFAYFHSVPLMTASTDRRRWTFEFQANLPFVNGTGFFVWWRKGVPTVGNRFDDVPLYVEIFNDTVFGRVKLRFSDNISFTVSTGIIASVGIPHTLSIEFFPPNQAKIDLNGIPVCTFTTTPGQSDFDHFLFENGGTVVAGEDSSLILDSFLDEKLA